MSTDEIHPTGLIHPSVFHASAGPLLEAETETRAEGAVRYRCPVNDSFVLVTDDETLDCFADRPALRRRCPACGELHLLSMTEDGTGRV